MNAMQVIRKMLHKIPLHALPLTLRHRYRKSVARTRCEKYVGLYEEVKDEIVLSPQERDWLSQLQKDGYLLVENLFDPQLIKEIRAKLSAEIDDGRSLETSGRSEYDHKFRHVLKDTLVHIPEVAKIAFDPRILRVTAAYKKLIPIYYGRAYRTDPMDKPIGSSYMHRDGYGDFTTFVFLHDTGPLEGSGYYVRGSHGYGFRSNIPLSPDERHLRDIFPEDDFIRYGGRAGTLLLVDTTGYHKGPVWPEFGSAANRSRDVIHWVSVEPQHELSFDATKDRLKIPADVYAEFDRLQRAFACAGEAEVVGPSVPRQ